MVAITRSMSKKKYQQHMREQSFLKEASSAPEISKEVKRSFLKEASQIPLPTPISESKSSVDVTCGLGRYPLGLESESPAHIPDLNLLANAVRAVRILFHTLRHASNALLRRHSTWLWKVLCVVYINIVLVGGILWGGILSACGPVRHFFCLATDFGKHLFKIVSLLIIIIIAVLEAYLYAYGRFFVGTAKSAGKIWVFLFPYLRRFGVGLKCCIDTLIKEWEMEQERRKKRAAEEKRKQRLAEEKRRKQRRKEEQRRRRERQAEEERRRQQRAQEARRRHVFEEWQRQQQRAQRAREEQQRQQQRAQRAREEQQRRRRPAQPVLDHYSILGVARNADANTIKKAYHRLALVHHPDKRGDPEMFRKVQEAWEDLRDAEMRAAYDARL